MPNNTLENRIKLSQYYLAYIDILGIQDAINSDKSEEYLIKIDNLYKDVLQGIKLLDIAKYDIKPEVKIFSDNIVIAIKKDCPYTLTEEMKQVLLINIVSYFQMLGIKYSFLTRGCIATDDLYINQTFIYGKALTRGYFGENKIAIYPRITIDSKCVNEFIQNNQLRKYFKKDFDGTCYLDSFQNYFDSVNFEDLKGLEIARDILTTMLKETDKDDKIIQKKYWIINKFNEFCQNNKFKQYMINIDEFPYNPNYIRTIYTAGRRKEALENAK